MLFTDDLVIYVANWKNQKQFLEIMTYNNDARHKVSIKILIIILYINNKQVEFEVRNELQF
jgi:hypothetical protein